SVSRSLRLVLPRATLFPYTTLFRSLRKLRLVVPCGHGLYKPASDAAVLSAQDPLVVQHAMRALSTLLETVGENVNGRRHPAPLIDRKSTRLNSSHQIISYAVFCLIK